MKHREVILQISVKKKTQLGKHKWPFKAWNNVIITSLTHCWGFIVWASLMFLPFFLGHSEQPGTKIPEQVHAYLPTKWKTYWIVPNIYYAGVENIQRKNPNSLTLLSPGFAYIVCFRQPISSESNNQLEHKPALPSPSVLSVPGKLKQMIFFLLSIKKAIIILILTSGSKPSFELQSKQRWNLMHTRFNFLGTYNVFFVHFSNHFF